MKVEFELLSETAQLPAYSREGDACMDVRSDEEVIIKSKSFGNVGTGLAVKIPHGYEMQVRARSGLAFKNGIGLVNGIGTVEENFRGEVRVILFNLGDEDFVIHKGDRIAQICFFEITKIEAVEIKGLTKEVTNRGAGGFGSSGIK